ncbi:MAG: hypothetical protein L0Y50_04950 [Beijerinckiaceae bacterium]|nr:hypothetical protein [Beijerinckiaceae bacterium]
MVSFVTPASLALRRARNENRAIPADGLLNPAQILFLDRGVQRDHCLDPPKTGAGGVAGGEKPLKIDAAAQLYRSIDQGNARLTSIELVTYLLAGSEGGEDQFRRVRGRIRAFNYWRFAGVHAAFPDRCRVLQPIAQACCLIEPCLP